MNHSNKDKPSLAESGEGRPLIKENVRQPNTSPTQSGERVSQGLAGVRKAAAGNNKEMTFPVALHLLWILPPPLFLIVSMFLPPLLLTFQSDLVILGVSRKFLAVIIGAALTLALRPTAHILLRTISGGRNEL